MASDNTSSFPPLPQLVAALAAIGGLLIQPAPPLWSARPTVRPVPDAEARPDDRLLIRARLWQDPLQTVRQIRSDKAQVESMDKSSSARLAGLQKAMSGDNAKSTLVLVACVPGDQNPESIERRLRARAAVLAGLGQARYAPKEKIGYFLLDYAGTASAFQATAPAASDSTIRIPVPYEELDVNFGVSDTVADAGVEQVKLIWLPDNWTGTNVLHLLGELGRQLWAQVPSKTGLRVRVLGPSSSLTLTSLMDRARHLDGERAAFKANAKLPPEAPAPVFYGDCLRGVEMIGCMPTVAPMLLDMLSARVGDQREKKMQEALVDLGVYFRRTIASDDEVVGEMFNEMWRRGVHAAPHTKHEIDHAAEMLKDDAFDHVAVISEWDTPYGRCLPLTVQLEAMKHVMPKWDYESIFKEVTAKRHPDDAEKLPNIHLFSYFKGIDGKGSGTETLMDMADKSGGARAGGDAKSGGNAGGSLERAQGQNQLDYLRRLAARLGAENEDLIARGKRLRAVMVLGSDLFDKFLIMRALRPVLPDALYITNNLDADMISAEESANARNLVIVSPFGLQLDEPYQRAIPPFRDSYQTSMFCGTLCAMRCMSNKIYPALAAEPGKGHAGDWFWRRANLTWEPTSDSRDESVIPVYPWMKPRVFEAGNDGFIDLTGDFAGTTATAAGGGVDEKVVMESGVITRSQGDRVHPARGGLDARLFSSRNDPSFLSQIAFWGALAVFLMVMLLAMHVKIEIRSLIRRVTAIPRLLNKTSDGVVNWLAHPVHLLALVAGAAFLLPVILYFIQNIADGEPLSWVTGVSVWPTQGLRFVAILVAVHLLCRSRVDGSNIRQLLHKEYFGEAGAKLAKDEAPVLVYALLTGLLLLSVVCIAGSAKLWAQQLTMHIVKVVGVVAIYYAWSRVLQKKAEDVSEKEGQAEKQDIRSRMLQVGFGMASVCIGFLAVGQSHSIAPSLSAMIALGAFVGAWKVHRRLALRAADLVKPDQGSAAIDARALWEVFSQAMSSHQRMSRVVLICTALVWTAVATLEIWPLAPGPARGWLAFVCDSSTFGLTFVALAFVTAAVIDAVLLERLISVTLQSEQSNWTKARLSDELQQWRTILGDRLDDVLDMRFLATRSRLAGWLAYAPFIVLALVIGAQSSYLDAYSISRPVIGVWTGCLLIACSFQFLLHRASISARSKALAKLQTHRASLVVRGMLPAAPEPSLDSGSEITMSNFAPDVAIEPKREDQIKLLDICIAEINGMTTGAFAPFWEQPFMKAIFFSSGGLGLTTILGSLPSILTALKS